MKTMKQPLDEALRRKRAGAEPWQYFDHRVRSPEEARRSLAFKPVPPKDVGTVMREALERKSTSPGQVIYVHIPFCQSVCRFCGYNRVVATDPEQMRFYFDALESQLDRFAETEFYKTACFDAVYFGGGTPTAAPEDRLVRLISKIGSVLPLSEACEITVESRIADIRRDRIQRLLEAGVNRMSFGVQSFDTRVRRFAGRLEDRDSAVEKLRSVREYGLENLCADLIYNLEKQDLAVFRNDLEMVQALPITGLDIYPLVLFERSILKKEIDEGTVEELPGIETEYRYFMVAEKAFGEQWRRFSPVHFGKGEAERATYVTARSRNFDVLALGAGAAGSIGNLIFVNPPSIPDFMGAQSNGEDFCAMAFVLPEAFSEYRRAFGLSEGGGAPAQDLHVLANCGNGLWKKMKELGLVDEKHDYSYLTSNGRFWSGNITRMLGEAISCSMGS